MSGNLCGDVVNCIDSFPNGSVYRSYISTAELDNSSLYNCHDDLELFLYVNKYNPLSKSK